VIQLVNIFQGRFEILSLSGSFLLTDTGGTHTRTGGLSVSLAGSDGRVIGGGVGGLLMAASPVQVTTLQFLGCINFYQIFIYKILLFWILAGSRWYLPS
jgi:hypothetical protein